MRAVLVAQAEPHFAAMEHAAIEFDGARREVEGLAKMLAGRRNKFAGGAPAPLERIARSMPEPPRRESRELLERGQGLDADGWRADLHRPRPARLLAAAGTYSKAAEMTAQHPSIACPANAP